MHREGARVLHLDALRLAVERRVVLQRRRPQPPQLVQRRRVQLPHQPRVRPPHLGEFDVPA
jgi:hypothetical protein